MPPFSQNPIANQFAMYSNPNPTLGTGAFQIPQMQAPLAPDLSTLGSGTFNMNQGTIPGFSSGFDSKAYIDDLNRYSGGALDGVDKVADNGFGMNLPTFQLGLSTLMGLGNLYGAYQSNKLANKSFDFSTEMAKNNYRHTLDAYNTAVEDKYRVRGAMEGSSQAEVQDNINRNRLA